MTVYKMYVTESASAAVTSASIDIQNDGAIEAVTLGVSVVESSALNFVVSAEVTFASTPQFTSNDVRASLCQAAAVMQEATATPAMGVPGIPFCVVPGLSVPVEAGERIWLHLQSNTASVDSASAVAYLFVRDGADGKTARKRR